MPFTAPVTVPAFGTTLGNGSAVANVVSIKGIGLDVAARKTTHLGSTWKSKGPTIPEGTELTFEIYYHATTHSSLLATAVAGTIQTWTLTYPPDDASTPATPTPLTFKAFVSKFEQGGIEEDGTHTATVTLTPTGIVNY